MTVNLFDSLNAARRLAAMSGALLEHSRRYPQRYALRTTRPQLLHNREVHHIEGDIA